MLQAACPERDPAELSGLALGQRDGLLLDLRLALVGPTLVCLAACVDCGAPFEFSVEVAAVRAGPAPAPGPLRVTVGGTVITARAITGADLDAVGGMGSVGEAREALIGRAVTSATRSGVDVPASALTAEEVAALGEALEAVDPWSDLRTEIACPECGAATEAVLDVAAFVWAELAAQARSLLFDVDALARRYGWSEAEILALSPARRRLYLDLA